jgi:peptidyl-dipeptidase A
MAAASGGSMAWAHAAEEPAIEKADPAEVTPALEQSTQDDAALALAAKAFLVEVDKELRTLSVDAQIADWTNQTDITPEHEDAAATTAEAMAKGITRLIKASHKFDRVYDKLDGDTQRQLLLLKFAGQPAPDDPAEAAALARTATEMTSIYGKGQVCDAEDRKALEYAAAHPKAVRNDKTRTAGRNTPGKAAEKHCKDLDALSRILQESRKPDELLATWKGWHDNVGKAEFPLFVRYVDLANAGARDIGFKDVSSLWRSQYDMPEDEFETEVDHLWNQVSPLYTQLHCYTRRRLNKLHGDKIQPNSGPIYGHLTGNMWAQSWTYRYKELEPYKGVAPTDVTPALAKRYDSISMVRMAEAFYTSIGMPSLPETFWQRSMFDKPKGKDALCHASAWDVTYSNDLRIKMCINRNQEDLITIHHELGHDYYFTNYYTLPMLYQRAANDGFDEAIGDTISLSLTPQYLAMKGLLARVERNDKATINAQMALALDKIAFLPFGLLIDKWRWDVFAGRVKPADYNRHWWQLKLKYQGIAPPVERTAPGLFDPGAKAHVATNTPYVRYFLAHVLQFQFHRALCQKAGFNGPLHECSIYGNKEAGDALRKMLAMGASQPWQEALFALTGQRDMDASAILEYFAPLQSWLEEQNKGERCGW